MEFGFVEFVDFVGFGWGFAGFGWGLSAWTAAAGFGPKWAWGFARSKRGA